MRWMLFVSIFLVSNLTFASQKLILNCSISNWGIEINYEIYTKSNGKVFAGNELGKNSVYRACKGNLVMMISDSPVTPDKDCTYFRSAEHQELFLSKVNLNEIEIGDSFIIPYNIRLNGFWNETASCKRID